MGRKRSCRSLEAPRAPVGRYAPSSISSTMGNAGVEGPCVHPRHIAVLVLGILTVLSCVNASEDSVSAQLRTLRNQVDGLLERRQEDFRVLEETIRQSVDKSSEVVVLKKEVEKLRYVLSFCINSIKSCKYYI